MAEAKPRHEADDGQIDLEFTEEAQEVTLKDDDDNSIEETSPEPVVEIASSEDDEHEQYSKGVLNKFKLKTRLLSNVFTI